MVKLETYLYSESSGIEIYLTEVNLLTKKMIAARFLKNYVIDFLNKISKVLDLTTANYKYLFKMCECNSEIKQKVVYLNWLTLKTSIKKSICFKDPSSSSCIDLMLTNHFIILQKVSVTNKRNQ